MTNSSAKPSIDLLTVAAIGVTMYILANVLHEAVGHAGACLMLGGNLLELSTAHVDCDYANVSAGGRRFVAGISAVLNILAGLGTLAILRLRKPERPVVNLALWSFMAVNLMVGTGYPLFSGIIGVGDYANVFQGLLPELAWRLLNVVLGLALYSLTIWLCLREMKRFIGADYDQRIRNALRATLIMYLAGSIGSTLGAFLNPYPILIATSSAAHFGGTSALFWMAHLYRNQWFSLEEPPQPFSIERSWTWIAVGVVLLALHIGILGPMLTFA